MLTHNKDNMPDKEIDLRKRKNYNKWKEGLSNNYALKRSSQGFKPVCFLKAVEK